MRTERRINVLHGIWGLTAALAFVHPFLQQRDQRKADCGGDESGNGYDAINVAIGVQRLPWGGNARADALSPTLVKLAMIPPRNWEKAVARNHAPMTVATSLAGESLVIIESPTGERQSSPVV